MATRKPKVFICTPVGQEYALTDLRSLLALREIDVCPRLPVAGTRIREIRDEWLRDLRGSDLYVVWVTPGPNTEWDQEFDTAIEAAVTSRNAKVLPVIEPPATVDSIPRFAREFFAARYSPAVGGYAAVADLAGRLLGPAASVSNNDVGCVGYLAEIALSNFFAFREPQTLDFHPKFRWSVILGDNGTGKTTLLRAIAARCAGAPESWFKSASSCSIKVVRGLAGTELVEDGRPTCFGYGAGRRATPARLSTGTPSISATLFDDHVDLPDAEEWILQSDHAHRVADGGSPATEQFKQVKRVLIELLPDVDDIKVESAEGRTRVSVQMHGNWHPMSSMSLGYKTALTWIVDLARRMFERFPKSDDPLKEPAIVLVDEIDLHLHPKWQRSLLEALDKNFPRVQFIVTAHSPLIVQAAPHANLVLLRRDGDRIVIDNDLDYIRDWRVDQILASELFDEQPVHSPRVQELLKQRAALLEAGPPIDSDRLREIDEELDEFPTAAMPEDQKAMDLIRRAAKLIQ